MSDLGTIFHVKKNGIQYDAHAYTTLGECPEPNLKLTYKGQQAYVKLEAKGSGDVPCYVKKRDGGVFQVKKAAAVDVPIGDVSINMSGEFTVPTGVTVIKVSYSGLGFAYVGVTPNTNHSLRIDWDQIRPARYQIYIICMSHNRVYLQGLVETDDENQEPDIVFRVRWSPEINKKTPTITDY